MHTYYLLLGTNEGNRAQNLQVAIVEIKQSIGDIIGQSTIYQTEPWGLENQPPFLNMALSVKSELDPIDVLKKAKEIENKIGKPKDIKWGPRVLDIDILYCDNLIMDTPQLKLPHPEIGTRNFVLIPLMEIQGDFVDPVTQITVEEMYDICTDTKEVYIFEE